MPLPFIWVTINFCLDLWWYGNSCCTLSQTPCLMWFRDPQIQSSALASILHNLTPSGRSFRFSNLSALWCASGCHCIMICFVSRFYAVADRSVGILVGYTRIYTNKKFHTINTSVYLKFISSQNQWSKHSWVKNGDRCYYTSGTDQHFHCHMFYTWSGIDLCLV